MQYNQVWKRKKAIKKLFLRLPYWENVKQMNLIAAAPIFDHHLKEAAKESFLW